MRAILVLLLGLVPVSGPALAGTPESASAVTILRGASAPPPPVAAPSPALATSSRQVVYVPYPVYVAPAFIGHTPRRAFHAAPTPTTLPAGWPLLTPPRR